MSKIRKIEVGIGVPSKYFTFSVPSDNVSAVTLYRARRETPHAIKKTRMMRSYRPTMPQPYPIIAGATPKVSTVKSIEHTGVKSSEHPHFGFSSPASAGTSSGQRSAAVPLSLIN
jgi:hypothetical protein